MTRTVTPRPADQKMLVEVVPFRGARRWRFPHLIDHRSETLVVQSVTANAAIHAAVSMLATGEARWA